jgi:hypothetical protein
MNVLPPRTTPSQIPIPRRHSPSGAYTGFRACLRWEFGFTCAFCLVHESDLIAHGIERSGLTGIEHQRRQETDPALINSYENCFYACRFCNGARGTKSYQRKTMRLLNPCETAWGARFALDGDDLRPRIDDADAGYTAVTYDVNDPRRIVLRRNRAETMTNALQVLSEVPLQIEDLLSLAERVDMQTQRPHLLGAPQRS